MKKFALGLSVCAAAFIIGCGGSTQESSNTQSSTKAKIKGTFEIISNKTNSRILVNRVLQATQSNNVKAEVYDINESGELVKDKNAQCEITGENSYECSVTPNGEYVVKIVQTLPNGKVAVLNTPVIVNETGAEANVTKETTLVTQVVIQKVKESLESLKDYGITDEIIAEIIKKIIPIVEQTIEEKIKSGELKISDADFIINNENVTTLNSLSQETAVVNTVVDKNVTVINTQIASNIVSNNTDAKEIARKKAIEDWLNIIAGGDNNSKELIETLTNFINDINNKININESDMKNVYQLNETIINDLKNEINVLKKEYSNNELDKIINKYPFFENPLFFDALNDIDNNLTLKNSLQLLLVDSILEMKNVSPDKFIFKVFNNILKNDSNLANKYKKPLIVYTEKDSNNNNLYFGTGSVYSLFTGDNSVIPDINRLTITYTDKNNNIIKKDVTTDIIKDNDDDNEGLNEYKIDLGNFDIRNYSKVNIKVTFEDNTISNGSFIYVGNVNTTSSSNFDITSSTKVYSEKENVDYILTWSDVNIDGYDISYNIEQNLSGLNVNEDDLYYCDYIKDNICHIDNFYGNGILIKLFRGDNEITITPQLIKNGEIVGKLPSVKRTIKLINSANASVDIKISGKINGISDVSQYKIALIKDVVGCNDNGGCNDKLTILKSFDLNSNEYSLDINTSELGEIDENTYITLALVKKDLNDNDVIDWSDIYAYPDNYIEINRDYYSGTLMISYEEDGNYYYRSIYEVDNLSVNFNLFNYDIYSNLSEYLIDKPTNFELIF